MHSIWGQARPDAKLATGPEVTVFSDIRDNHSPTDPPLQVTQPSRFVKLFTDEGVLPRMLPPSHPNSVPGKASARGRASHNASEYSVSASSWAFPGARTRTVFQRGSGDPAAKVQRGRNTGVKLSAGPPGVGACRPCHPYRRRPPSALERVRPFCGLRRRPWLARACPTGCRPGCAAANRCAG